MATVRSSHQHQSFYESLVGISAGAIATPVVRVAGGLASYLLFGAANAAAYVNQFGPLFYMDGNMAGDATAAGIGEAVRVSPLRAITDALTCTDPVVAGMPLYLQDDGTVDNIKGTFPRQVGTVLAVVDAFARTVTWLFDGSVSAKHWVEYAAAIVPLAPLALRVSSEEFTIAAANIAPYPVIADTTSVAVVLFDGVVAPGLLTVSLPPNPVEGQMVYVKDGSGNAAVNNIRVDGNGNTFEGAVAFIDLVTNGTCGSMAFLNGTWRALSGL